MDSYPSVNLKPLYYYIYTLNTRKAAIEQIRALYYNHDLLSFLWHPVAPKLPPTLRRSEQRAVKANVWKASSVLLEST